MSLHKPESTLIFEAYMNSKPQKKTSMPTQGIKAPVATPTHPAPKVQPKATGPTVYYFEHYPHFTGTMNNLVKLSPQLFSDLCTALQTGNEDLMEKVEDQMKAVSGKSVYAINGAESTLQELGGPKGLAQLRAALKAGKAFPFEWEEGYAAFALDPKEAKNAIRFLISQNYGLDE